MLSMYAIHVCSSSRPTSLYETEDLHVPGDGSVHEKEEEEDGDWIINLQSGLDSVDPSPGHAPFPADSSTLPCSTPPVQVNTMPGLTHTGKYDNLHVQRNAHT